MIEILYTVMSSVMISETNHYEHDEPQSKLQLLKFDKCSIVNVRLNFLFLSPNLPLQAQC